MNRGYAGGARSSLAGTPKHFSNAQDTIQDVKNNFHQWGRTATMPSGALRGSMPPPPPSQAPNMLSQWSSDTDSANNSLNVTTLKRGLADDDTDAILANAFDDEEEFGFPSQSSDCENRPLETERVMRPLPARGPFQATKSMPPLRELPSGLGDENMVSAGYSSDDAMNMTDEPYRHVDFSAYTMRTDNF